MPQVDFYLIPPSGPQGRLLFACRLLEKAYQQASRVYVHLENLEKTRFFDQLLWTFRDDSFLPHGLSPSLDSPIELGHALEPQTQAKVLLNLHSERPPFHERFERILEIFSFSEKTESLLQDQRLFYEEKGYILKIHHLQSQPTRRN